MGSSPEIGLSVAFLFGNVVFFVVMQLVAFVFMGRFADVIETSLQVNGNKFRGNTQKMKVKQCVYSIS